MSVQKKFLLLSSILFACNAYANINANNGFYIGGDIMIVKSSLPPGTSLDTAINLPLYFRPYIGYRFTDYIAIESGFNDIQNKHNKSNGYWGADHYRLYSFDFFSKLIMPFSNGLSVFGKAGAAYTHQDVYNQIFANSRPIIDKTSNVLQGLIGIGISYNFTKNISTDLSLTHLFQSHEVSDINMAGLGLSYTFNI